MRKRLFFFGVGNVARVVADQAAGKWQLLGTTRNDQKIAKLKAAGIEPILIGQDRTKAQLISLKASLDDAYVLVSLPPDGTSDREFALLVDQAKAIIYISSTGVYGRNTGIVDETTPVDEEFPAAKLRLEAEHIWQERGAIVLRAPGLYDSKVGLHKRLQDGSYHLPADGSNYTSRIHLTDLARIIIAAFERPLPAKSTYVVGDLMPTTQKEVVSWLCEKMQIAMPSSMPLEAVPLSLRGNRRVLATKILTDLGIELEFPSYKEGFANCLSHPEWLQAN